MSGNTQFKVESGLVVNGNSNVAGDLQVSGNLTVGGTTVSTGNAVGDILPAPTTTYSLGSATQRWLNFFTQRIDATGSVNATSLAVNSGGVLFGSAVNATSNNIALGNTTARWDFYANNANLVTVGVSGLSNLATVTVSSTLAVTGLATLTTANATGQSDFRAAANVAGAFGVVGAVALSNTLTVAGAVTVTSNTTLKANSTVTSFALLGNNTTANISIVVNTYNVTGNAVYANTVSVTGAVNALATLGVSGTTTLANLSAGAGVLTSNATQISIVNGALSVNTGSKISILTTGNSTVSNLALNNDLTTVQGNVSFRSGALFVDAVNNRVGIQNTAPDAPLTVTGAANVSGAVVIGGALLVQGAFTNSAAVSHNSTTGYIANQHVDHSTIFINAGAGLTGSGNITANVVHAVLPNNGISANASGVFAVGANGIIVTTTGININANTGVTVNTSGIFAVAASPGGPLTAVQLNDNSTFGGNNSFVYDLSTNTMSLANAANISVQATVGNSTVNTFITGIQIKTGNTTVNAIYTSNSISLGAFSVTNTQVQVGNTTQNAVITNAQVRLANSTSNISINIPAAATFTAGLSYLNANGSYVIPDHNTLTNYVADQHVAHSGVSIVAGNGLTGGGTIAASRTVSVLANNGISSNATGTFAVVANGMVLTATGINVNQNTGIVANVSGVFVNPAAVDHNLLLNYVADQHVAHSGVTFTAGVGLTGGGTIAASRTVAVNPNTGIVANTTGVFVNPAQVDHNLLLNYVADQHVAHTGVTITAGSGLTGGGDISTSRTVAVNPNTGISANSSGVFNTGFGKQAIYIPAASISSRASANGCAFLTTTTAANNQPETEYLAFDASSSEFGKFNIIMPKSWNEGTVTAIFCYRRQTSGSGNTVWGIRGVALANNATTLVSYGANATVTHTPASNTENLYITGETGPCTIAGSPSAENLVLFEIFRDAGNASDTMLLDAWLTGVTLYITTDAINDA